jgi:hypothetical protein
VLKPGAERDDELPVKLVAALALMVALAAPVDKLSRMAPGLNRRFDAAGLRDCGSNQA